MTVNLKKILKKNPQNPNESKWYFTQQRDDVLDIRDIAREIEARSALTIGDVQSVLTNLVSVLPTFLRMGSSVRLEGFGSFHLSVSSGGAESAEELTTGKLRGVKIVFLPSEELKNSVRVENLSFKILTD
jgi:predicted histone-like DNA-binding protein